LYASALGSVEIDLNGENSDFASGSIWEQIRFTLGTEWGSQIIHLNIWP